MVECRHGLHTVVRRLRDCRELCYVNVARLPGGRRQLARAGRRLHEAPSATTSYSTTSTTTGSNVSEQLARLNPSPESYSITPFADQCVLTLQAGAGGHGCISFLREKFIPDGPANGGDGGTGGSVYIQAVKGETSLHKLARRGILKAGRGKNGTGKGKGGERGEDILIQVPVGTTIREIARRDPLDEEDEQRDKAKAFGRDAVFDDDSDADRSDQTSKWRSEKWLLYPAGMPRSFTTADFPALPRPRRSNLAAAQPAKPIRLDLDAPMESPLLLAAGALGGLGNPHFVTKSIGRPKFATKGGDGMTIQLQLELKLLADVGLVGLPNVGKSTLLRSLTRSQARIGSWAFTTLQPNIGTVVLDDHKGRVQLHGSHTSSAMRESFTIADIPGLIQDAHLDRGLGLGFLRHVERAGVLAFVVDLSSADAVESLKGLWREVSMFETYRERELHAETERRLESETMPTTDTEHQDALSILDQSGKQDRNDDGLAPPAGGVPLEPLRFNAISSKPWMVVATKADLPQTEDNFHRLRAYLDQVEKQGVVHPSGRANAWRRRRIALTPVSAIKAEGVGRIIPAVLDLLNHTSTLTSNPQKSYGRPLSSRIESLALRRSEGIVTAYILSVISVISGAFDTVSADIAEPLLGDPPDSFPARYVRKCDGPPSAPLTVADMNENPATAGQRLCLEQEQ